MGGEGRELGLLSEADVVWEERISAQSSSCTVPFGS